ncbi:MAG: tetratricopeptide repeat protein [Bacteroidales bacterium]
METNRIIQQHKRITRLISERKVKQSIDILEDMIRNGAEGKFNDELDNIVLTYRNILSYTIEGVEDPERDKIYFKLLQSILNLADRIKQDILSRYSGWHTYWVKQQLSKEMRLSGKTLIETVDDLLFKQELDEWLRLSSDSNPDPESELYRKHRHLISNIFNHLWITDYYGEAEESLIDLILNTGKFRWHEASIFVSAITLSLFRTWQSSKVFNLISIYENGRDQVKERALVGLILALHHYNDRLFLYPAITEKLREASIDERFREHSRLVVLQAIRSRETESLSRKMNDEILPKMAKLKPRLDEKLDLENILPMEEGEGRNPDWSKVFDNSDEIMKTMEELTNLQMEGADVYMSAFSNMKHFDFFKEFSNWFIPFYPENETIDTIYSDEILGPGINELSDALYKTPFICNSDKYSLLLNLKYLPANQKTMMLKVFRMELEGLEQMISEEPVTDPYKAFRMHMTQYMQDLYRFFKLSPYKKEFEDIFNGRMDIYNSGFFREACSSPDTESSLASYFFSKNYFDDALDLFLRQVERRPDDVQLYEKIGYCYQEAGFTEEALGYYRKAELIDRKVWTIKKIGLCYRRLGKFDDAITYYQQAIDIEPDNAHTMMMIAHCHLDLKEYESALKDYFRIEYLEPGNIKVLRPIAWCYLALGKLEESGKYYNRLSEHKLNGHDLVNMGHLALCKGNKKDAVEYYRKSIVSGEISRDDFHRIMNEDMNILQGNGVKMEDLPILLDYLFFIVL